MAFRGATLPSLQITTAGNRPLVLSFNAVRIMPAAALLVSLGPFSCVFVCPLTCAANSTVDRKLYSKYPPPETSKEKKETIK